MSGHEKTRAKNKPGEIKVTKEQIRQGKPGTPVYTAPMKRVRPPDKPDK
jgi:hypothetical protein